MNKKLLTEIMESRSKINVLADESTRVGDKSTLIVFLRASVDGKAAHINFPLDLVELESLCASLILLTKLLAVCSKMATPSSYSKNYSLDFAVMELARCWGRSQESGSCLKTNFLT